VAAADAAAELRRAAPTETTPPSALAWLSLHRVLLVLEVAQLSAGVTTIQSQVVLLLRLHLRTMAPAWLSLLHT